MKFNEISQIIFKKPAGMQEAEEDRVALQDGNAAFASLAMWQSLFVAIKVEVNAWPERPVWKN